MCTGNVLNGLKNAYSLQNTARYNAVAAGSSESITESLIDVRAPSSVNGIVRHNFLTALTVASAKRVIYNNEGEHNIFEFNGSDFSAPIIDSAASPTYGGAGGNVYRGIARGGSGGAVNIRYPHETLDLKLSEITGGGCVIVVGADYASGHISMRNCSHGVEVRANYAQLDMIVANSAESGGASIIVVGTGNDVRVQTDKNVILGGTSNRITGRVGGVINITGGIGTHDISSVMGYSRSQYEMNCTTDENGFYAINHGLKSGTGVTYTAQAQAISTTGITAHITGLTSTVLTVRFREANGAVVTGGTTVSFYWSIVTQG